MVLFYGYINEFLLEEHDFGGGFCEKRSVNGVEIGGITLELRENMVAMMKKI